MKALAVQSFGFGDQLVRVVDRDGGAWFVANDVCNALELINSRQAVSRLDADERDAVTTNDAMGRDQSMTIVSESGVYALIFKSRKPSAAAFRKWVTSEVLPTLRTTGRFEIEAANDAPVVFEGPDFAEKVKVGLNVVREARLLFGLGAARRAWAMVGLPDVSGQTLDGTPFVPGPEQQSAVDWLAERTERDANARWQGRPMHQAYVAWCEANDRRPISESAFGRFLTAAGIYAEKNGHSYRLGVRPKAD